MAAWLQEVWLRRGPWAMALLPLSLVYASLAGLRALAYRIGWARSIEVPVPVVVVGNLVAGGAGKTPTVMAIVAAQRARGFRPGIVSRGHGRHGSALLDVQPDTLAADCGDEPLLLRLRTGAPVVVGRDRVAAARELLRLHPAVDLIVSDDGLQHLRLARRAQVLVFDERGVGNGWLLPAGPLRERMPARSPPRSVVLYNAPAPSTALPGHLAHRSLAGAVSLQAWSNGRAMSLSTLHSLCGRPMLAAAGVARPERFFSMLEAAGLTITRLPLPDHWSFESLPWPADGAEVIVTEKDAVKLRARGEGTTRVWVAALDFVPHAGFDAALAALLPVPPAVSPPSSTSSPLPPEIDHGNTFA